MANVEINATDLQAQLRQLLDETSQANAQAKASPAIDRSMRSLFWRPVGIAAGIVVSVSAVTIIAMKLFT